MSLILKHIHWGIGGQTILEDVNLTIKPGECVGIVGPNGCGKTSLLNIINGFHHPRTGSIEYHEKDITRTSVEDRARIGIGRVFQNFGIFRDLTLEENLALAFISELPWWKTLLPLSLLDANLLAQIDETLRHLHLHAKKHKKAGELSGGQMRLLEIGRLSLQKTDLLLLDEPTAGVSPKLKKQVSDLLKSLVESGKTVIIVEHDFHFLGSFVDRLIVMDDGGIVLDGKYSDIKESQKLHEVYFE